MSIKVMVVHGYFHFGMLSSRHLLVALLWSRSCISMLVAVDMWFTMKTVARLEKADHLKSLYELLNTNKE